MYELPNGFKWDWPQTNQKAIDLVYEYCDSNSKNYFVDAKEMFKYLRNRGIALIEVGDGKKDYQI